MTLSTTANIMQYSGNGVTTVFSFPYLFYADADLKVYIDSDLQASGYTVSGAGVASGGSVTFSTAPLTGTTVTIQRLVDIIQETDFENFDGNPADVTEKQFDLCVMMAQQNADSIFRALKYPATISGITDASLPTPIDGKALVFSGTTGAIVASSDYITDAITDATAGVTGTALLTATSTTSLATTGTGNKTWVIESGRGYAMGQRLRVSSDDGTKINEGRVTSYSGTSLIINVDYVSGSGTHADWNISVIGDRGAAGSGAGDMLASNNLSDVASKPTAFNTIKQAATTSNSGVVELATVAEGLAGTDAERVITAEVLGSVGLIILNDDGAVGTGTTKNITVSSGVKRVTLFLSNVSFNATDNLAFQLGDAGGIEASGYTGSATTLASSTLATVATSSTAMMSANTGQVSSATYSGKVVFEKIIGSTNSFLITGTITTGVTANYVFIGNKTLSQELTTIRILGLSGSNFDSGTVTHSEEF